MNLPDVDLGSPSPGPARPGPADGGCAGAQPIVITIAAPPAGDADTATTDAAGDARTDARGDARTDAGVTHSTALALPEVELPAPPLWQRIGITLSYWGREWWRHTKAAITNPSTPWNAQPESLAAHNEYRKSRAWVPPSSDGKFTGPAGNAYHLTFGNFGEITGYAWAWLWGRPLRIGIALVICGAVALGFWLG